MPTQDATGVQSTGTTETDARIDGPIPEFDHRGDPTSARYFRCRRCGREAMRRGDLEGHDCRGEVA